jgi:hypothetical protein
MSIAAWPIVEAGLGAEGVHRSRARGRYPSPWLAAGRCPFLLVAIGVMLAGISDRTPFTQDNVNVYLLSAQRYLESWQSRGS